MEVLHQQMDDDKDGVIDLNETKGVRCIILFNSTVFIVFVLYCIIYCICIAFIISDKISIQMKK